MNKAIINAAATRAGQFLPLLFGGVAVLAIMAAILFARRVTKPAAHLVGVAQRVGQGDLLQLVPVTVSVMANDKIGELSQA